MVLKQFKNIKFVDGGVCAAKGFKANGIQCGISPKKKDLALIFSEKTCTAAAVYTTNKVKAAPITVTRENLKNGCAQAIIVNSGNANACTADGLEKASKMCSLAAKELGISENDVIVASTGVIGQILPIEPVENGIKGLCEGLSCEGNTSAMDAIMTTDTIPKEVAAEFKIGENTCVIGGMLKGSGMIHPNMATNLTFITTDADISSELLQQALDDVVKLTLNRVSVDGDTSTNDMACILASGMSSSTITRENDDFEMFRNALYSVMMNLGRMMARDGEGATKLIECLCTGAETEKIAEAAAKSVITSSLFKAAMFGADANWGRILCALGYADAEFDITKVDVDISSSKGIIAVCRNGAGTDFSEEKAKEILMEEEILISIRLCEGEASAVAWGCDLTYDYVKINGDYRS